MVLRKTAGGAIPQRCPGAPLVLLAVAISAIVLLPGVSGAQEETVLKDSGIHYPQGYDPNTVGDLSGVARDLRIPAGEGPVRFRLETRQETYVVMTAPPWAWRSMEGEIPEGASVRVRGSKTLGRDGVLYVIAQEVEVAAGGRSYAFRDEAGYPLWKGPRGRAPAGGGGKGGRGIPGPKPGGGNGRR